MVQTGALEGQNVIKNNQSILLSNQDLIDCSRDYANNGCKGGWSVSSFRYVMENGITADKDYEYKAADGSCESSKYPKVKLNVSGYTILEQDEDEIQEAVGKLNKLTNFKN